MPIPLSACACTSRLPHACPTSCSQRTAWRHCQVVWAGLLQLAALQHTKDTCRHATACSECAGPCVDSVWKLLKCQTTRRQAPDHLGFRVPYVLYFSHTTTPDRWGRLQHHASFTRTEIRKWDCGVSALAAWNAAVWQCCWIKHRLKTSLFNCAINSDFVSSSSPSYQTPLNLVLDLRHYTSLIYYYYYYYNIIIIIRKEPALFCCLSVCFSLPSSCLFCNGF